MSLSHANGDGNAAAGPSGTNGSSTAADSVPQLVPGPSPYHESSQFLHWRYAPEQLSTVRAELNAKSVEVVARNSELEKEAQLSLGHAFTDPPPSTTYLTVEDELLLLRFYCTQVSQICRKGFGLPEVVESTAITYLKRFYLKNSVMEWHPKTIMPTCLFLAAKTTNYPVLMDAFIPKFAKLSAGGITDTEFLVAQSLSFEFWIRGPEKPLRGFGLDMQTQPGISANSVQAALGKTLEYLSTARLTDVEFLYTPAQIALTCWRMSDRTLVSTYLDSKYADPLAFGMERPRLEEILDEIETVIAGVPEMDMKKVKDVDRRLKGCTNPEKIPGTALYIKHKQQVEAEAAAQKAAKSLKTQKEMSDTDMVFGDVIRKPLSPRMTLPSPRGKMERSALSQTGMGVKDDANGLVAADKGLLDVGRPGS